MARRGQDVTEAELAVLSVLWDRGPQAVRQLAEEIYGESGASVYATVQKLLERLAAKGCVKRDRGSGVQTFSATINRDDLIGRRLRAVAETLCGGSLTPLLTHLVKTHQLSARERQALRDLIDDLDRQKRAKDKQKGD